MDPRHQRLGFLLVTFVATISHSYAALGDNCASDEGTPCMATLHTLQAKDGGDVTKLTVPELVARCAELRRNLACVLTHTQSCVALPDKRDQHAKVILEARKYIAAVCEADESVKAHWKDSKCYRQALLQRCDREFQELMQQHKAPSNPPTNPQCEIFRQYQSCVQRMVASCSDDSEQFVALYLLDYGASLAWQCPNPEDPNGPNQGSGRHQANVIQTSGGGGSSSPLDPLGPQGPQESGGSQQGSGKNTGATRKTMADIRRIPVIRDTHFVPPHKIEVQANTVVDDPSAGNASFGSDGLDDVDSGDDPVLARSSATTTSSSSSRSSATADRPANPTPASRLRRDDGGSSSSSSSSSRLPEPTVVADFATTAHRGHRESGDGNPVAKQTVTIFLATAPAAAADRDTQIGRDDDDDGVMSAEVAADMAMWLSPVDVSSPIVSRHARDVAHLDFADNSEPYSGPEPPDYSDSAAFSGNSGSTCVKLIQNDMRRCYNRYQRQESELKKQQSRAKSTNVASDAQQIDAKPKVCCAFGAYAHCLQTAVQTRCSQDREALVDTIIAQTLKLIGGHCEEYFYGSPKCSSGASPLFTLTSYLTVLVALLAILPSVVARTMLP